MLAVGETELGVLLRIFGDEEATVLFRPQPGLRAPAGKAVASRPLRGVEVRRAVAGKQMVDVLRAIAAQGDRDELSSVTPRTPGRSAAVEERLAEAETDVVQPEMVTAGMI